MNRRQKIEALDTLMDDDVEIQVIRERWHEIGNLVKAAPDLLEACKRIIHYKTFIDQCTSRGGQGNRGNTIGNINVRLALRKIEKAIEKAEGKL